MTQNKKKNFDSSNISKNLCGWLRSVLADDDLYMAMSYSHDFKIFQLTSMSHRFYQSVSEVGDERISLANSAYQQAIPLSKSPLHRQILTDEIWDESFNLRRRISKKIMINQNMEWPLLNVSSNFFVIRRRTILLYKIKISGELVYYITYYL